MFYPFVFFYGFAVVNTCVAFKFVALFVVNNFEMRVCKNIAAVVLGGAGH